MSTNSIPKSSRQRKGSELAATKNSIYEATPDWRYLVRSQASPTTYYEVTRLETDWACTCPDYRKRRLPCKHIEAVKILLAARDDLERWASQYHWTNADTLNRIEARLLQPHLDEHDHQRLHIYHAAASLPTVRFALRYWWPDYHPEQLLDDMLWGTEEPAEISVRTPAHWSEWRPISGSVESIQDYIAQQHLDLAITSLAPASRRHGRWEGQFDLIFTTQAAYS